MAELDLFLNGPILNITTERARQLRIRVPLTGTPSAPTIEVFRALTRRTAVVASMLPTPTLVGGEYIITFTAAQITALNNLAGEQRTMYLKYRCAVTAAGAETPTTILCGRLVIGPVGSGRVVGDVLGPVVNIYVGDIVFGDVPTPEEPPVDPEDPDPPEDTLANATFWGTDFVEAWAANVYATWQ